MAEVRRVTTIEKSKKKTTTLLIIVGIVGVALLVVAIIISLSTRKKPGRQSPTQQITENQTCGCYFIDTDVTTECSDSRKGFNFKTQTSTKGGNCSASCVTADLDTSILKTDSTQFMSCPLDTYDINTSCAEMVIKDDNGKIITGKISSTDTLTVTATFEDGFTNKKIYMNNLELETKEEGNQAIATITPSDIGSKTLLTINANATNETTRQTLDDKAVLCKRIVNVTQDTQTKLTGFKLGQRQLDSTKRYYVIDGATITVGNLTDTEGLKIAFSFSSTNARDIDEKTITMTDGYTIIPNKGEISISQEDLYKDSNFTNNSFTILNGIAGTVKITAILQDKEGTTIGRETDSITIPRVEQQQPVKTDTDSTIAIGTDTDTNVPPITTDTSRTTDRGQIEESNFMVQTSTSTSCVEWSAPDNETTVEIRVTNNTSSEQVLTSVIDKLPRGFVYKTNSTSLNGQTLSESNINIEQTGETVKLTFQEGSGWTFTPGETKIITFTVQAGENALSGTENNKNEVSATTPQIPLNPTTLQAMSTITVAQDCQNPTAVPDTPAKQPDTGLFDSTASRIFLGILITVVGWIIYSRPSGQILAKNVLDSKQYKSLQMTSWKLFNKKKYFEKGTVKEYNNARKRVKR
ncbi:hypothetical protein J6Z48_03335 [bacterium]|nr:hypothetical protein [bacterium]